jgi:hypothetical protein
MRLWVSSRGVRALEVACPAGTPVNSPAEGFSVVCGVIERENRDQHGPQIDPLVSGRREPKTILSWCCAAVPQVVEVLAGHRDQPLTGYVNCPVWRVEQARRDRGTRRLDAADVNYGGGAIRL